MIVIETSPTDAASFTLVQLTRRQQPNVATLYCNAQLDRIIVKCMQCTVRDDSAKQALDSRALSSKQQQEVVAVAVAAAAAAHSQLR